MDKIVTSISNISGNEKKVPELLCFEQWGKGSIFNWYNKLTDPAAKSIQKIQIWMDISGPVPHRFVVLHMRNKQIHRFDRRPNHSSTAHLNLDQSSAGTNHANDLGIVSTDTSALPSGLASREITIGARKEEILGQNAGRIGNPVPYNTLNLISNQAVTSADSYMLGITLEEVDKVARCEVEITLRREVDIAAVISTCYAIHHDEETSHYSLFRFNCFFFSWTILMIVSRHNQPYTVPLPEPVRERFKLSIDQISEFMVDEGVALFLDLVIETIVIMRRKAGNTLNPGMSAGGRLFWKMPINVLRFIWRRLFEARLYCGLREQLLDMAKTKITDLTLGVHEAALSSRTVPVEVELNEYLWIEDMRPTLQQALEKEIMNVFWPAILESISGELKIQDQNDDEVAKQMAKPSFKFLLLGKNAQQFCAISSAALIGGLKAVKDVAAKDVSGQLKTSHELAFDQSWDAASKGALEAAQRMADHTNQILNNTTTSKRAEMYRELWRIWDSCWEEAHQLVKPRSVQVADAIVKKLMECGAEAMILELRDCKTSTGANVLNKSFKWRWPTSRPNQPSEITTSMLQESMHAMIKKDTISEETLKAVCESMSRIWKVARGVHPIAWS